MVFQAPWQRQRVRSEKLITPRASASAQLAVCIKGLSPACLARIDGLPGDNGECGYSAVMSHLLWVQQGKRRALQKDSGMSMFHCASWPIALLRHKPVMRDCVFHVISWCVAGTWPLLCMRPLTVHSCSCHRSQICMCVHMALYRELHGCLHKFSVLSKRQSFIYWCVSWQMTARNIAESPGL